MTYYVIAAMVLAAVKLLFSRQPRTNTGVVVNWLALSVLAFGTAYLFQNY